MICKKFLANMNNKEHGDMRLLHTNTTRISTILENWWKYNEKITLKHKTLIKYVYKIPLSINITNLRQKYMQM